MRVRVNGTEVEVSAGMVVAVAVARAGRLWSRRSVIQEPRGPLCGIGVCYECRVTINGQAHQRGCLVACQEGMEIEADE
ncbi:MAG: (2Fe-2S)-binding protein [Isosphaeraceae bacterium]|nr:MAG: (2Fe-2S)-binding protein [Isosphaeraceae bacterium]